MEQRKLRKRWFHLIFQNPTGETRPLFVRRLFQFIESNVEPREQRVRVSVYSFIQPFACELISRAQEPENGERDRLHDARFFSHDFGVRKLMYKYPAAYFGRILGCTQHYWTRPNFHKYRGVKARANLTVVINRKRTRGEMGQDKVAVKIPVGEVLFIAWVGLDFVPLSMCLQQD
jgi:hypothetical protein